MRYVSFFLCFLFFSVELFPQLDDEWLNDDVDVAYVEPIHSTNIGYIEEHFSGYTFSTYSYGDQVKRFIFETRLRYNELLFDHTTLNFEYRYQNSFFDTPVKNNSSNEKFNKTFSYDLQEFRELYVQQTINDFLSFKGGKQTIIWGQWSTFSPIDLLLPFDFAVIGPSFNKEQIKQPIEAYNLTFSPNDQWFTTLYYFPHFTLDNSSKESLDYAVSNGRTVIYPDPDKDEQLALRSLYVGDKTTYAITLFKGYEVIRNQFSEIDSYHFGQTFSTSNKYMFPQKYALALEAYQRLNDSDSLGIEILIQSRKVSFDNLNSDYFLLSNTKSTELQNYLDWVQNSNSGNFYATQYVLISSIGYEKFLSRHVLKLSVSYIHLINPDHTQKGFDYYDLLGVTDSLIDWTETYRFLGSLTYLYYLTEDQNQSLGMVLGFLGSGVGGSAFYGITFEESLTFGFGVEYIKYLSDLSFGTSDTGEQIVNVDEITYRSGLQYTF